MGALPCRISERPAGGEAAQLVGNVEVAQQCIPGERGGQRLVACLRYGPVQHVSGLLAVSTCHGQPVNRLLHTRIGGTCSEGGQLGAVNEAGDAPGMVEWGGGSQQREAEQGGWKAGEHGVRIAVEAAGGRVLRWRSRMVLAGHVFSDESPKTRCELWAQALRGLKRCLPLVVSHAQSCATF